ncbi:MAG TPA: hypothetical protein VF221_14850 [Chloroflexota bacterium]
MTFARGVFIFAFVMLILGGALAKLFIGPFLFPSDTAPGYVVSSAARTSTPATPRRRNPNPHPTEHAIVLPTATAIPVTTPTVSATPRRTAAAPIVHRPPHHHALRARPATRTAATPTPMPVKKKPTARPTATALPRPTPTTTPTGVITLTNYWVGATTARAGNTIAVGYVIDNQTGHTARVELGASVMPVSRLNWATSSISDPAHDVVAVVPPGVSTHVRYFSLAPRLKAGSYSVAWGLRDAATGQRVALSAAADALRVQGVSRYVPAP